MTLQNQEHIEAAQNETNLKKDSFIRTLEGDDLKKFEATEKCVEDLKKAGVEAFIFSYLPTDTGLNGMWQFNTIKREFDENGRVPPEEKKRISEVNCSFVSSFYNHWIAQVKELNETPEHSRFNEFVNFFIHCLKLNHQRVHSK